MEYRYHDLLHIAENKAIWYKIPITLLYAIIEVESNWNIYACRHEPAFQNKYITPKNINDEQEEYFRACSWGLGQIMGQVARERGYVDSILKLINPYINLEYVCKQLQVLYVRYDNWTHVISAYNQGNNRWVDIDKDGLKDEDEKYKNQKYVAKVNKSRKGYEQDNSMVC